MAGRDSNPRFQHSLWDRLTNPDLIRGSDVGVTVSSEIERIKNEVRRDLEWLLNSRRTPGDPPAGMSHLSQSLMTYGLPDITSVSPGDTDARKRLTQLLESVIRDFEPRLSNVRVIFEPQKQDNTLGSLHYRIEAILRVDPAPEPVIFDTVLQLGNKAFIVNGEDT